MWGFAIGFVNNESPFNFSLSLQLVILVIVGGMGRRLPVVIAALVFWIFPSWISGLHAWAYVIGAVLLMFTVSRHPEGIGRLLADARKHGAGIGAGPVGGGGADEDADDLPRLPEFPAAPVQAPAFGSAYSGSLLEVSDVVVRFGGLRAVDEASLQVAQGKIIGLIGPNGAGKSTLFNAICGMTPIDTGRILYRGREIQGLRADQRARLGIARTFQQVGLAKELTVHENFLLAQHQLAPYGDVEGLLMLPRAGRAEREFAARADAAIESLGFEHLARLSVGKLSGGQQRIVEIASLLITGPELVMLDEPSAGMAPAAAENLAVRLKHLRDATGQTVLIIEHNVPLVLDTCDYVYVLDAGQIISQGPPEQVAADERVIEAYFGAVVPV
jgi:branched-chain amino acid transport system ATP-binding protein